MLWCDVWCDGDEIRRRRDRDLDAVRSAATRLIRAMRVARGDDEIAMRRHVAHDVNRRTRVELIADEAVPKIVDAQPGFSEPGFPSCSRMTIQRFKTNQ